jgi:threonine synthase
MKIEGVGQPVSLEEGSTPLIPAPRLANALGLEGDLFLKFEGLNPTGSFKDRGMTTAITDARAKGAKAVICASTGNTAASAAAYAARAGMACYVLVPEGKVALGKLAASVMAGAVVVTIKGSFDDGLRMVREAPDHAPVTVVNSVNEARMEGQKTSAFEICEDLGDAPDWLSLPVGNAGNITAYWRGFNEQMADGLSSGLPKVLGTQAVGAAPIVGGHVVENPETVCTAIRIGNPARWKQAEEARDQSSGRIIAACDEEILHWYRQVAALEGVFTEPSSAAGIAGLAIGVREGWLDHRGKKFVCILTGHGMKDPDCAMATPYRSVTIEPKMDALLEVLR